MRAPTFTTSAFAFAIACMGGCSGGAAVFLGDGGQDATFLREGGLREGGSGEAGDARKVDAARLDGSGADGARDATSHADGSGDGGSGSDASSDATAADAGSMTDATLDHSSSDAPQETATGADAHQDAAHDGATQDGAGTDGQASDSGGAESGVDAGGVPTFLSQCAGQHTKITGTVYAPNATDPIPNVRVYDAVSITAFPTSYCDLCSAPIDRAYASTFSAADGSFTLNLDGAPAGATIDFTIQIGRFRKHTTYAVAACTTTTLPGAPAAAAMETLPGKSSAGDIPKIAVSSGNADHLDAVLTALGISEYDCYEGRATAGASTSTCAQVAGKTIADVLVDPTTLDPYHMAFLSCAPGAYAKFITSHSQATMSQNTASWVAGGGRLFVTDTAYDYIAAAFPPDITWAGPAGTPAGAAQPVDGANIGCAPPGTGGSSAHAVAYPVRVDNATLASWLKVVGFTSSPAVTVQGFYEPWSTIASIPAGTTLIADGTMPVDPTYPVTSCAAPTMTDVPLTTEFDVPTCGRVLFSSYHTYTGTGASATAANLKIMEYLIFDAAVCHGG